ncbi:hypothetical protein [Spirosoma sp.]|uniref:hypothetical protein n=1 Tax=Spirosoma sp. TaxID=1899569 RepID=UPI00262912B3|nr:hypothetical protein [Spirosoma sp.]MCX6218320.1 hypothetical protein [Spirosoma sp.]
MGIINTLLAEKKAERRVLTGKLEVINKQINDLEKELKTPAAAKPATAKKTTKPARKSVKK